MDPRIPMTALLPKPCCKILVLAIVFDLKDIESPVGITESVSQKVYDRAKTGKCRTEFGDFCQKLESVGHFLFCYVHPLERP